ncbi:MAG TPA: M23 family metallopeptidase, partial [Dehalococcoidia bacterium]|nr:M23 family metallopeptidase [Dehalococcoidia bacterium]
MRHPASAASVLLLFLASFGTACSSDGDEEGLLFEELREDAAPEEPAETRTPSAVDATVDSQREELVEAPEPELRVSSTWMAPGSTILVSVRNTSSGGTAYLLDREYPLTTADGYAWAVLGTGPDTPLGGTTMQVALESGETFDIYIELIDAGYPVNEITLSGETSSLLTPENSAYERERVNFALSSYTPEPLWEGTFIYPVQSYITSEFGEARSYNGGPITSWHKGIDFGALEGTPIRAANSGRVVLAEEVPLSGGVVFIDHGLGVFSQYSHQSAIHVEAGQMVEKGDIIGEVGSTGISTGAHLHWQMFVGYEPVNPHQWCWQIMT